MEDPRSGDAIPGRAYPRFDQHQNHHRGIVSFEMHDQLEPIGEERLHHQAHLVLREVSRGRFRLNLERLRRYPFGQVRIHGVSFLFRHEYLLIGELDIRTQGTCR
jgi:hypothetical protein